MAGPPDEIMREAMSALEEETTETLVSNRKSSTGNPTETSTVPHPSEGAASGEEPQQSSLLPSTECPGDTSAAHVTSGSTSHMSLRPRIIRSYREKASSAKSREAAKIRKRASQARPSGAGPSGDGDPPTDSAQDSAEGGTPPPMTTAMLLEEIFGGELLGERLEQIWPFQGAALRPEDFSMLHAAGETIEKSRHLAQAFSVEELLKENEQKTPENQESTSTVRQVALNHQNLFLMSQLGQILDLLASLTDNLRYWATSNLPAQTDSLSQQLTSIQDRHSVHTRLSSLTGKAVAALRARFETLSNEV